MQLSVVTATYNRPSALALCLEQFRNQVLDGLSCEHVVVSDGADPQARLLARRWQARYFELTTHRGHAGAFAKDFGVREARGKYICFWDDDNLYSPTALARLAAIAGGVDVGVLRVEHRLRKRVGLVTIPRVWRGEFRAGDIDTMCVCVKRELALKEAWGDESSDPGTDFRWLQKLSAHRPRIRYGEEIIGIHL